MAEPFVDSNLPGVAQVSDALEQELRQSLAGKGAHYEARTEHKDASGHPTFVNRLIDQTSPYLLQHAHNPVNWHPWGDAPFLRAKAQNKLVLLSVGYATCHWCHVMERESFEDVDIAAYINEHFVPIKVDREERPDVDAVYMTAVQMIAGQGGWPMTMFLNAAREPIFGGTYFPPRDGVRGARIGFLTLLRELVRRAKESPDLVQAQAARIKESLQNYMLPSPTGDVASADAITTVVNALKDGFDPQWGGFGGAPKFPRSASLELLLRYARRTGDADALTMATTTLERMAGGGIYDHAGGGFHRYSVDEEWLVPHFEKMLYDNAQLAVTYLEAWQATQNPLFKRIVEETLDYMAREMRGPHKAFFSATDADSLAPDGESHEGLYFTWTPDELAEVLGTERARVAGMYWGVTPHGNFEGRSILHTAPGMSFAKVAQALKMPEAQVQDTIAQARNELYEARQSRTPPLTDDKVLTSWNALAISAFARAGFALTNPSYLAVARDAADFVLTQMQSGGTLLRAYREGQARIAAYLDDYAFMIAALLDLYEATGEARWLSDARTLQHTLDEQFGDTQHGGYFFVAHGHEPLLVRDKPDYDGAEPSGNSVAAQNLLRLGELVDDATYTARAKHLFAAFAKSLSRRGQALPRMLCALDFYLDRPRQVVIVAKDVLARDALVAPLRGLFAPNQVRVLALEGDALPNLALLQDRDAGSGARAYVCQGNACGLPTSDPATLLQQLAQASPYA